jgi:hypothetical protein
MIFLSLSVNQNIADIFAVALIIIIKLKLHKEFISFLKFQYQFKMCYEYESKYKLEIARFSEVKERK